MQYRQFGETGWKVSDIGYGMWGMGEWTESDDAESLSSLQAAVDLGCNFFDSAYSYGDGHSERLLASLIKGNPDKRLYSATKIPPKNRIWPSKPEFSLDDCYPSDHIEEYIHKSLANLGIPTIDLIQFHTWNDNWVADDRWAKKIEEMKHQKLVNAVGISIHRGQPWNGINTVKSGLLDAVQVVYNIFDQSPEDELFPACREQNVAVIARVPFDEGTLTGTLTLESKWAEGDWRNSFFSSENLKNSIEHVEQLKPLIPSGMTMPEMALRYILNNPHVSTIIPGMRKLRNVQANIACSDAGPLSEELHGKLRRHRWIRTRVR